MGGGGRRLYPASYQLLRGWLTEADVPEIKGEGTYQLAPLWGKASGAKAYRLARADGSTLWLEFRQPQPGFDNWKSDDPFVNGVIVRTVAHAGNVLTNTLVDATPGSAQGMKDAPLMPGHALHDTLSGKIVTVKSVGPNGAVVEVKNDGCCCRRRPSSARNRRARARRSCCRARRRSASSCAMRGRPRPASMRNRTAQN